MTAKSLTTQGLSGLVGLAICDAAAAAEVLNASRISQTLGVLAVIVAGIFALAYVLRRVPGISARAGGALKLIDALSIGTRERLLLVEVDGDRLVLAVAPGRIERLHVVARSAPAPATPPATFATALTAATALPGAHA
jgi:flagellar protein FliO/FliZ